MLDQAFSEQSPPPPQPPIGEPRPAGLHVRRAVGAAMAAAVCMVPQASSAEITGQQFDDIPEAVAYDRAPEARDKNKLRNYVNYHAFGDSISAGVGTSNPETKSYPARAGIRGFGIGSSCLQGPDRCTVEKTFKNWWPEYVGDLKRKPKTAIVEIGVNDLAQEASTRELIAEYKRVIRIGKKMGIRVVFATIVPAPRNSAWVAGQPKFEVQRDAINKFIRSRSDYIEISEPLENKKGYMRPRYTDMNDVHPNDEGAKIIGEAIREWVIADAAKEKPLLTHKQPQN